MSGATPPPTQLYGLMVWRETALPCLPRHRCFLYGHVKADIGKVRSSTYMTPFAVNVPFREIEFFRILHYANICAEK
jgi:hypothetical protein